MQLFYSPHIVDDLIYLDENDSRHATKVLRLQAGSPIQIVDGLGNWYHAEVDVAHSKKTSCKVLNKEVKSPLPYHLHIAIAPTKNIDRIEWFLEKATEMGISEITPIICDHSERKVVKPERLERIVVSAMKQSLKAHKPVINPLHNFNKFISSPIAGAKGIAHCEEGERSVLRGLSDKENKFTILIGPEGDFSLAEINLAKENGFTPIVLGPSRLRTETAALVAVSEFYSKFFLGI